MGFAVESLGVRSQICTVIEEACFRRRVGWCAHETLSDDSSNSDARTIRQARHPMMHIALRVRYSNTCSREYHGKERANLLIEDIISETQPHKVTPRIYCYILAIDDGVAPCVDNGVLTLAICKPAIRRTAIEGDWIIGISPKEDGHKLCYGVQVTSVIPGQRYYMQEVFRKRGDSIYSFDGTRFNLRKHPKVHNEEEEKRDLGKFPNYRNAFVLMSSGKSFWYYGKKARSISPKQYPALNQKLNRLQQGHRVRHFVVVHKELLAMVKRIRRRKPGVDGDPRNPPSEVSHDSYLKRLEREQLS